MARPKLEVSDPEKAETKKAEAVSKFRELSKSRVTNVKDSLLTFSKLAGRKGAYTEDDVAKLRAYVDRYVNEAFDRFAPDAVAAADEFDWDSDTEDGTEDGTDDTEDSGN